MGIELSSFSPEVQETLRRYAAYGWRTPVIAKILNCRYGLSLTCNEISELLSSTEGHTAAPVQNDKETPTG